jgi:hypothetical protein
MCVFPVRRGCPLNAAIADWVRVGKLSQLILNYQCDVEFAWPICKRHGCWRGGMTNPTKLDHVDQLRASRHTGGVAFAEGNGDSGD